MKATPENLTKMTVAMNRQHARELSKRRITFKGPPHGRINPITLAIQLAYS